MAAFTRSDDLRGAGFAGTDLRGARFAEADLSGVVMRGVEVRGLDIDTPWLFEDGCVLRINGVDVVPLVEAELSRRYPGRELRRAAGPDGLRAAWAAVETTWAATLERAAVMPAGTVGEPVSGEWSFAQTLRHLVFATDLWLGRAVLQRGEPFHPLGLSFTGDEDSRVGVLAGVSAAPPYAEVLAARASRVAMVGDFLAGVTAAQLDVPRANPHGLDCPETTLSCLHTILAEEWEHHRYAVRDLDAIEAGGGGA